MEPETEPSDATAYFGSADEIVDYLNLWMEDGSPREIARALGDVARSKGMTEIAPGAGIEPQALYPALSRDGNPTLDTLTAVLDALGLELSVRRKAA
jgi:probable addiction module antidote protein